MMCGKTKIDFKIAHRNGNPTENQLAATRIKKHADKKQEKTPRGFLFRVATLLHVFNSVGFLFLWAKVASKFV